MQNVSQAVRAFCISGKKAQFNGVGPRGENKYNAVSTTRHETSKKIQLLPKATPGSYIDFHVNPTITALASLSTVPGFTSESGYAHFSNETLKTDGLLDILSIDFSRALKDLAAVLNDLKRLSDLGDLPITYQSNPAALRVHFPGCDSDTVETLCSELDVQRGVVVQDPELDAFIGTEIALLFPFAPTSPSSDSPAYSAPPTCPDEINWQQMLFSRACSNEDEESILSQDDELELHDDQLTLEDSGLFSPEGYESLACSSSGECDPLEYQNFNSVCRFMNLCEHRL